MKALFWLSVLVILITYSGYPLCMFLRARFWPRPISRASVYPRVAIVLTVRNEQNRLPAKLDNLQNLDYPADFLTTIVVSDGSTDETNNILEVWQGRNRECALLQEHLGKANALNHGIAQTDSEIVCFTDVRQMIPPEALKHLMMNFADPSVGCASGELMLCDQAGSSSEGVGLYWRFEKNIRKWEQASGSTVGATGAFYAARKELLSPIPQGTILDDLLIPLQIARQGRRVVFDPTAVAWDDFVPSPRQEFRRKVRTLAGNYQLLQFAPWVLTNSNPLRLRLICHKLLRLLVPFALLGILISTMSLRSGFYGFVLAIEIGIYGLAGLSALRANVGFLSRLANIALAFIVLNTAAFVAFFYFISGRKVAWAR